MPRPEDDDNNYNNGDRERAREDREENRASSRRIDVQVAVLEQRLRQAVIEINALRKEIQSLHGDLDKIVSLSNKYRGGLLVILAVGGLIGWITTLFHNVLTVVK